MNKIKIFFYVFKNSIVSPKYYNDILKTKLEFSIKYFVFLSFILSLIFTSIISIRGVPETKKGIYAFVEQIKTSYPDDLIVDFKDGSWEINKEEPYIIPMPKVPGTTTEEIPQRNLIVLDKKGTIEDLETYDTLSIMNETNFVFKDQTGKITAQPIKNIKDFSLDKATVISELDNLNKYLRILPYFVPVFILTFDFLFNYIGKGILNTILIGFLIYILSLIRKEKISYKSACQIVMHTMTVPLMIELVLRFTEFNSLILGWFSMLNILIATFFMVMMKKEESIKKIEKKIEE